jgi:glutamate transport system permease protein
VQVVLDNWDLVVRAFTYTVLLFLIAGVLSMVFGTLLAAMRVGPIGVLARAAAVYVTMIRNTPLLIVLIFFRIAGPKVGIQFNFVDIVIGEIRINSLFASCVGALTVYTSTFVCEALRSGVNAVPLGQAEAARAIGLPFGGTMRHVVLPQAFRASVPPLASVQIALLKNTTVCGVFGVSEAFFRMKLFTNDEPGQRIGIFLSFALIFVLLVEIVSFFANRLERRWRVAT